MLSVHRNFPKIGKDVQSVIPAIVAKGRVVVVVTVSKGIDKPYFDRNGGDLV